MQANIYQQYKAQTLETLTRGEIVIKLFEEGVKQINTAILLLGRGDVATACNCIAKSKKIVATLQESLDRRMAISIQLSDLYTFILKELGEGLANHDTKLLKELADMLDELKVTFKRADIVARSTSIHTQAR